MLQLVVALLLCALNDSIPGDCIWDDAAALHGIDSSHGIPDFSKLHAHRCVGVHIADTNTVQWQTRTTCNSMPL